MDNQTEVRCTNCGKVVDQDDAYLLDGKYICDDCIEQIKKDEWKKKGFQD